MIDADEIYQDIYFARRHHSLWLTYWFRNIGEKFWPIKADQVTVVT